MQLRSLLLVVHVIASPSPEGATGGAPCSLSFFSIRDAFPDKYTRHQQYQHFTFLLSSVF